MKELVVEVKPRDTGGKNASRRLRLPRLNHLPPPPRQLQFPQPPLRPVRLLGER